MKRYKYIACILFCGLTLTGCTDLDETVYDKVMSNNYYNTKADVIRAALRPFEHAFWSITLRMPLQELPADQIMTCKRDSWWEDGGKWRRLHYHTWTVEDDYLEADWDGNFKGIMQCNYVIDDLANLTPEKYGFTQEDLNDLTAQSRVLRAWFYLRLLDAFRNVPLAVSKDASLNSEGQVAPIETFRFIEKELKECLPLLKNKEGVAGNGTYQGQWTSAGAAALLVRLYLNAEKWIGEDHYADCATYASNILNGNYGTYSLEGSWDKVFDWDNETSNEVIFGFPSAKRYSHWLYDGSCYWWSVPQQFTYYVNDRNSENGDHNPKYALTPSHDLNGNLYDYKLGNTVQKFQNYPEDYRLKLYRNLGNSTREGMMVFGSLEVTKDGKTGLMTDPDGLYELYIRDAVGQFKGLTPDQWPADKTSDLTTGDHQSGWQFVKYPLYSDNDEGQLMSDYAEIRLPEIIYSLAECKFRGGQTAEAARLLNSVRKRNYPQEKWSDYLYVPEGKVTLTEQELLDEWGREFLGEARRRTDLIRFGKFNSGIWWDKKADADNHTEIFPIPQKALDTNHSYNQNPNY